MMTLNLTRALYFLRWLERQDPRALIQCTPEEILNLLVLALMVEGGDDG